jgi:predicted tellurium resistance membrane protein TerC
LKSAYHEHRVFAIDSILVAVAMSPKLWVVLTGGILGIVMMRLVIGTLLSMVSGIHCSSTALS